MLKAGTGRVDISPRKPMFLWGYPHVERTSTGIHDPLYATALCFDDGERTTLAIGLDILYVEAAMVAECRRRIEAKTGIAPESVLISATHTHSGPVTCDIVAMRDDPVLPPVDLDYLELVTQGVVEAACEAANALQPAEVAITAATVDGVGCNRLDPDGPRDPEAGMVVVRRAADQSVMAVQLFYSMHPTVMHEDSALASSDFPHYTRVELDEAFPGVRVVYHNGPCGNLSPRYHVKAQTFDEAERLGRRLGRFVVDAVRALDASDFSAEATVGAAHEKAQLMPRRFMSVEQAEKGLEEARATYERLQREKAGHGPVRTAECVVFGAEEVLTLSTAQESGELDQIQKAYASPEVQVLRIDDAFIVGLPGELFVEYALEIKQRAQAKAFVSSVANGHFQGYITTPDAVGYEANLSMFKPESGAVLVEKALDLMDRVAR